MAAKTDSATFAVLLVAAKEITDIPGDGALKNLGGFIKDATHDRGSVWQTADKTGAREKIPVGGASHNALGHMTTR